MINQSENNEERVFVAIDIAKRYHAVLVQYSDGHRKAFKMANNLKDYDALCCFLKALPDRPVIGFEATGDYHRTLAYRLLCEGFELHLVSSLAVARTRDALIIAKVLAKTICNILLL